MIMDRTKVFETVKEYILNQLSIDPSRVTLDADLVKDLGADSANLMMLVMDLEGEYDTTVEDSDIAHIKTVGDIVECIMKRA